MVGREYIYILSTDMRNGRKGLHRLSKGMRNA